MFLLLVLCACQKTSQEPMSHFATFTVDAVKDDATKALSLDGNTLNAYWKSTENVLVYNTAGELIGTLNVAPEAGERPSSVPEGGQGSPEQRSACASGSVPSGLFCA